MPVSNNNGWTLRGTVGELHCGALCGNIDVARPELGLQQLRWNGRELEGHLLGVRRHEEASHRAGTAWPLPLADSYVRGDDLVAGYKPADDWPYSPQLYWSAAPLAGTEKDNVLGALSLLISVETHLLDTWPRVCVGAQLPCHELLQVLPDSGQAEKLDTVGNVRRSTIACCLLYRLTGAPISYVEIMPPADFRELSLSRDESGHYRAAWHLFADFLEKGVIRRARLQSAFLPREHDVRLALASCAAMRQRPLPLTT